MRVRREEARVFIIRPVVKRLADWVWFVYPVHALTLSLAPDECLLALERASLLDSQQLQLRNLFTEGRRYYLWPRGAGFWMTSNSRPPWRRGRTSIAAVLQGRFSDGGAGLTRLTLRARMRVFYLVDALIVPVFMLTLLVFAPWSAWLIGGLVVLVLALSWAGHRLAARLQAAEMIYFTRQVLADVTVAPSTLNQPATSETITPEADFRTEWDKFYRQQAGEDPVPPD